MTLFTEAVEVMARAVMKSRYPRTIGATCVIPGDVEYDTRASLTALLAFLSERGLRVVPVEATEGMQYAATKRKHGPDDDLYGTIYAAMIAAAADPFKEPTK